MRGPLLPRAPLGALLLPLLLLLAARLGTTSARPHATETQDGEAAPLTHSFYQPGAWRPVVRPAAAAGAAFAPRSAAAAAAAAQPLVSSVASRVRVEDSNRSGRVDVKPPSSASTAAGTSTAATQRSTTSAATATTASAAAATSAAPTTASAAPPSAAAATTVAASVAATYATTKAAEAQLGAAIHRVTSQLLTAEDVRTPPKLRHQQEHRAGQAQGQGVAVPVILEEDELERAEEVLTRRAPPASTAKPQEEGLSTWVLLSGSHASTPTPTTTPTSTPTTPTKPKPKPTPRPAPKRPPPPPPRPATAPPKRPAPATPPARKPTTTPTPKPSPTTTAPAAKKNASTYDAPLAPAMTRKPPTTVHKTTAAPSTTTTATTTTTTTTAAAPLEDEAAATVLPTATEPTETDGDEASEASESKPETSTRRTRRPGSGGGKKKKNKNKRRKNRPGSANGTALAESKVGEQADGEGEAAAGNGTRPAHAKDRPLTTRIYNYLAREVMPSFGVGLLGLAITAGLAGLIMYPFGGGAVKRTYEVDAPALPSHGNFYYYAGDYDQGDDHGQAEESVIRKVFEGMQGAEGEPAEEQRYAGDGADAAVAGGTVTTYAGDVHGGQPYATQGFGGGPALAYNGAGNYYNVEQANKYYSSSPSGRVESGPMQTAPATNANATAADGRVRYHEAAPAHAEGGGGAAPSPSAQQITKKSDYYAYNAAGRVRYRDVGTGEVSAHLDQAPRVRFREVGSDTVHYSLSDQTSSEGGVEHGPRHVRVRRQTLDMADIGRKMADAHRQMAAEVADFADHAKKVSDKSVELGNEIEMLFAKKSSKPKKPTEAAKQPMKMKKEEMDDDCDTPVTKSMMDEEEDDEEVSTSIMDPETSTDYESHVELVTGVPDHTSMEELAEQVQDDGAMNEYEPEMPVYVRPTYASAEQVEADTTTTMDAAEQPTMDTAEQSTNVPETPTDSAPGVPEVTTAHSPTHAPQPPPPQSSIVDLLKQIAQLKIKLGIDFLKSTSRAFASYLDGLQRNMEDAIKQGRTAQYRRTNFWNYRRSKRDAKKTLHLKKKKSKSD